MDREKLNIVCKICGESFWVSSYFLERGWGKYCSKKCKDNSQKTGRFVLCSYCGRKVYRIPSNLSRRSKTKKYFCNNSCHCSWKNKHRKNKRKLSYLWRPWCNSSTTRCGRVREDANSFGLPLFRKKKVSLSNLKRPPKKTLKNLYWKKNYTQVDIAKIFGVTHTSVKRWFIYYKISIKPRTLSCGRNVNSLKNLELGKTDEVWEKSARARTIYSKEKLIEIIGKFVQKEERVPTKNDFAKNPLFPDSLTFRDYFGTWNNAIKAAGYNPNEQWFSSSKRNLHAKDGHLCNSISEIIIDDWLFGNNIYHSREEAYPEGKYRCDFVVKNVFVEFFGLANAYNIVPNYQIIMETKRKLCKKHKIPLIELYEKDLYNLNKALGERLKKIGNNPTISIFSFLSKKT